MKNYYLKNVLILSFCIMLITQNSFSQDFDDSENSWQNKNYCQEIAPVNLTGKTSPPYKYFQDKPDSLANITNNKTIDKGLSFLLKAGVDASLTFFDEAPIFLDAGFRFQWKMKFYELGIGPDLWYCPGNDSFYKMMRGYLLLNNNFYYMENEQISSFIFVEFGKDFYWNDLESNYSEFSLIEWGYGILNIGLGLKFGKEKRTRLEMGWHGLFDGFYDDYEQSFGHVGIGYTF